MSSNLLIYLSRGVAALRHELWLAHNGAHRYPLLEIGWRLRVLCQIATTAPSKRLTAAAVYYSLENVAFALTHRLLSMNAVNHDHTNTIVYIYMYALNSERKHSEHSASNIQTQTVTKNKYSQIDRFR